MQTEKEVLKNIGLRLIRLREQGGYTSYEQFAIENDLSRMHYWTIEKGRANITFRSLINYPFYSQSNHRGIFCYSSHIGNSQKKEEKSC